MKNCNKQLDHPSDEIVQLDEEPCNFCGTPSLKYPKLKCSRTPICTNYEDIEKEVNDEMD